MKLAELKSEAQIYNLRSAGANTTAHEFKQELIHEQQLSLNEMRSEMKLEEASMTVLVQKRFSDVTRSEHEARDNAIALRSELQTELTLAQLNEASNAQLNMALDRSEHTAFQESQEIRNESAVALQYKNAVVFLDVQNSSMRAMSVGLDSNPTGPEADQVARDVLAALKPDQEQIVRDQRRIHEQLSQIVVSQKAISESQRDAFATEVRRMRIEFQEYIRNANPIEQPRTSWRATSPA